jgi:hypothetical protein
MNILDRAKIIAADIRYWYGAPKFDLVEYLRGEIEKIIKEENNEQLARYKAALLQYSDEKNWTEYIDDFGEKWYEHERIFIKQKNNEYMKGYSIAKEALEEGK